MRRSLTAALMTGMIALSVTVWAGGFGPPARVAWTYEGTGALRGGPVTGDGRVNMGGDDGAISAMKVETGQPVWRADVGSKVTRAVTALDDRVYAGTEAGHVVCLRPPMLREGIVGVEEWRFAAAGSVEAPPLLTSRGAVVFGSSDGIIYALDRRGALVWQFETGGPILGAAAVTPEPKRRRTTKRRNTLAPLVYCGSADGIVYAFQERDGRPAWTFATGAPVQAGPITWRNVVIAGNQRGKVLAFNARSGRQLWSQDVGAPIVASPVVADGRLYVVCQNGAVLALDLKTGKSLWDAKVYGPVTTSPAATSTGHLFIASETGMLYCLRRPDGRVVWAENVGESITTQPTVVGRYLFIGTAKGKLMAYVQGGTWHIDSPPVIVKAAGATVSPEAAGLSEASAPTIEHSVARLAAPMPPVALSLMTASDDPVSPAIQVTSQPTVTLAGRAPKGSVSADLDGRALALKDGRFASKVSFDGPGAYPVTLRFVDAAGIETLQHRIVLVNSPHGPSAAVPVFISPNRAGGGDSLAFSFCTTANDEPGVHVLRIHDSSGAAIIEWASVKGADPGTFTWDGRDQWGRPVPDGQYVAVYTLRGLQRGSAFSVYQPIIVDNAGA